MIEEAATGSAMQRETDGQRETYEQRWKNRSRAGKFDRAEDATAPEIKQALKTQGVDYVLDHYMGLKPEEPLYGMIKAAYES